MDEHAVDDHALDEHAAQRIETENLIEAIWGLQPERPPEPVDPIVRAAQNRALAKAMRAYLQQYLADVPAADRGLRSEP